MSSKDLTKFHKFFRMSCGIKTLIICDMICRTILALTLFVTIALGQQSPRYQWGLPPGVPPPRVPAASPMTAERIELGRRLFYDTRLSGNGKQACATCHLQNLAFTDGRAQAIGSTGEIHPRSSMSLINVAYRDALTWANPSLRTFEDQLLVPLFGTKPVELGLQGHESKSTRFSQRIRSTKKYSPRRFLE